MSISDRDARTYLLATRIGYVCRMMRLQRRMTLEELANKTGYMVKTLQSLERGESFRRTIDEMAIVAWALDFEWELKATDAAHIFSASGTEARQRPDPEEGLDPKGDGPTLEERDAQTVPSPSSRERK